MTFSDKGEVRKCVMPRPHSKEMLTGVHQAELKWAQMETWIYKRDRGHTGRSGVNREHFTCK